MQVIIAGCGSLGSVFAAALVKSGEQVQVYQRRGATFNALRRQGGVRLIPAESDAPESYPVERVTDDSGELEPADLIIVLVKAYSTKELEPLGAALKEDGVVLTLQNGMGNAETLAEFFGAEKVAAGVATYGAYTVTPGTVKAAGTGLVSLGPWEGGTDAGQAAELLQKAGFTTEYVPDPRPYLWRKLALNAMVNTVAALCRVRNGLLRDNRFVLDLMERLGREALEAAGRAGVTVDFRELWDFHMDNLRKTAANKPSMLQDVKGGRPTEVDGICGAVLEYAEDGEDFPATRTIYQLIKGIDTMPQAEE
jgi:2-dehydropantoate 2-reductase